MLGKEMGDEIPTLQMQYDAGDKETDQKDHCCRDFSRPNLGHNIVKNSKKSDDLIC